MELDLFVASTDKVIDDVRRGGISTSTAKPLATSQTFDNAFRVMNSTVPVKKKSARQSPLSLHFFYLRASVCRKLLFVLGASEAQRFHAINWDTCQALRIIVVVQLRFVIIVVIPTSA